MHKPLKLKEPLTKKLYNMKLELSKYPKTKAEFEQWFMKTYKPDVYRHYEKVGKLMPEAPAAHSTSFGLYRHPFEMQQGVFLAFLREKGIYANSEKYDDGLYIGRCHWYLPEYDNISGFEITPDYNTALIAAIEAGFAKLEAA